MVAREAPTADADRGRRRAGSASPPNRRGTTCSRAARATGCATTRRSGRRFANRSSISSPAATSSPSRMPHGARADPPARARALPARRASSQTGAGQGAAKPGDTLRPADAGVERGPGEGERRQRGRRIQAGAGVQGRRHRRLADRRARAPDLTAHVRRGRRGDRDRPRRLGRRGIRARLDRRRTVKQAIMRRAIQPSRRRSSMTTCGSTSSGSGRGSRATPSSSSRSTCR